MGRRRRRQPDALMPHQSSSNIRISLFILLLLLCGNYCHGHNDLRRRRLLVPVERIRGGADDKSNNNNNNDNKNMETEQDAQSAPPSSPDNKPLSLSSLFRLHNELKAQDEAVEEPPTDKGRGGALATLTNNPSSETSTTKASRILFGAFDTSSVAPLSRRLLQDEEKTSENAAQDTENVTASEVEPAKMASTRQPNKPQIWWNNAWQQQFPSDTENNASDEGESLPETETKTPPKEEVKETMTVIEPAKVDDEEEFEELEDIVKSAHEARQIITKEKVAASQSAQEEQTKVNEQAEAEDVDSKILPIPKEAPGAENIILPPSSPKPPLDETYRPASQYESSGYWTTIDNVLSAGFAHSHPNLRISRRLRVVRKQVASVTGMHGFLSGKRHLAVVRPDFLEEEDEKHMGIIRRRLAAIDRARGKLRFHQDSTQIGRKQAKDGGAPVTKLDAEKLLLLERLRIEQEEAKARHQRVQQIDKLMAEGQQRLQQLATEKDILQKRPNPLWNYTTSLEDLEPSRESLASNGTTIGTATPSREFKFPPPDLVDEYLTMLFTSGRLVKLNHTELWRNAADEEDEGDDDDWLSPRNDLMDGDAMTDRRRKRSINGGSGSRWLRNGLGEKLGETVETAAYRAVGGGVMSFLARLISSIHGINVMRHTDIRLFAEQAPNLPPSAGFIPGTNGGSSYAQGAFETVLRKGSKKSKKRRRKRDDSFIQRDAVVETLLSQCQIAAPLLKIFPLAWQRAMLGNIVTLVTATMMDFFEGLEFEILGHRLSFAFVPITEEDMLRHWASAAGDVFSRRHKNAARFEAAVQATAEDVAENLNFLDKWHERVLGGDALKTQLSNLVARLVLTLVDETLSGARMDLWTTHAGGPRLIAGLEYRTEPVKELS